MNIDIAPTLLELAQVPIPPPVKGRSLVPLLKDPGAAWRQSFFAEYFQEKAYPRFPSWQAIRDTCWKYIHYQDLEDMDELYEITKDPFEMKNRIKDAEAGPILEKMKKQLGETVGQKK